MQIETERLVLREIDPEREFGIWLVGGRAHSSPALEFGWIHSPLPAVDSGESMTADRVWLSRGPMPVNKAGAQCKPDGPYIE